MNGPPARSAGFSLVEAMLALVMTAVAVGLLIRSYRAGVASEVRARASDDVKHEATRLFEAFRRDLRSAAGVMQESSTVTVHLNRLGADGRPTPAAAVYSEVPGGWERTGAEGERVRFMVGGADGRLRARLELEGPAGGSATAVLWVRGPTGPPVLTLRERVSLGEAGGRP